MLFLEMVPRLRNYIVALDQFLRDLEEEGATIAKDAHRSGYTDGHAQGHATGFRAGKASGYDEGYSDGLRDGLRAAAQSLSRNGEEEEGEEK